MKLYSRVKEFIVMCAKEKKHFSAVHTDAS